MTIISSKTKYGLPAVLDLARGFGKGVLSKQALVDAHRAPSKYMEHILARLAKEGVIKALRGTKGGYQLARSPDQITLWEVLVALEGHFQMALTPELPIFQEICLSGEKRMMEIFNMSLADYLRKEQSAGQAMYHI